jgi:small subunit ribosomal protein S13
MARVAGVDIPLEKKVNVSLRYIFGIGPTLARKILSQANVDPDKRVKELGDDELVAIRDIIEKSFTVEGALRRQTSSNIKRHKDTGSYRGLRHSRNLPAHGQRTRTNARTKKGRRPLIGGMKKKEGVA